MFDININFTLVKVVVKKGVVVSHSTLGYLLPKICWCLIMGMALYRAYRVAKIPFLRKVIDRAGNWKSFSSALSIPSNFNKARFHLMILITLTCVIIFHSIAVYRHAKLVDQNYKTLESDISLISFDMDYYVLMCNETKNLKTLQSKRYFENRLLLAHAQLGNVLRKVVDGTLQLREDGDLSKKPYAALEAYTLDYNTIYKARQNVRQLIANYRFSNTRISRNTRKLEDILHAEQKRYSISFNNMVH